MSPRAQTHPYLRGYIPAVPTPFDESGDVDIRSFEKFCDHLIRSGARALVVGSATGELPTLKPAELEDIIRAAVDIAAQRAAVIVGANSNATAHAAKMSRAVQKFGADAILAVAPYYNKPTQAGLQAHFHCIAKEIEIPLVIHDAPAQTACKIANETVLRLSENPRIVGLVDSTGDLARFLQLRAELRGNFVLLSGDDATAPAFRALGGEGCVSNIANIAWELCSAIESAAQSGKYAELNVLAMRSQQIVSWLSAESNPARLKYALALRGFMTPMVRRPLVEPDSAGKTVVIQGVGALTEFQSVSPCSPPP